MEEGRRSQPPSGADPDADASPSVGGSPGSDASQSAQGSSGAESPSVGGSPGSDASPGAEPVADTEGSPLEAALARVGDRWSLLVVEALLSGPHRFGELQRALPGIATNVLSQRLRRLEAERVVVARPYNERPVRYAYDLTAAGRDLAGALRLLSHWGAGEADDADVQRHTACGSPMEVRWYCPTCARVIDADEADHLHYA